MEDYASVNSAVRITSKHQGLYSKYEATRDEEAVFFLMGRNSETARPFLGSLASGISAATVTPSHSKLVFDSPSREEDPRRHTNAYLAAMRRTESKKLRDLVVSLAERSEEQDFFIWTAPLTSRIRALLNDLSAGPDEGNSREILRSLRDSLMDGGWESYRKASARAVAIKVLDLLKAVKVCAADADRAYELMACAGLSSAALLEIEEAWDDEHHGEEEAD